MSDHDGAAEDPPWSWSELVDDERARIAQLLIDPTMTEARLEPELLAYIHLAKSHNKSSTLLNCTKAQWWFGGFTDRTLEREVLGWFPDAGKSPLPQIFATATRLVIPIDVVTAAAVVYAVELAKRIHAAMDEARVSVSFSLTN